MAVRTDPMTPDEREAKLPGWTRDTLRDLRRRVRDAERIAAAAEKASQEGSELFLVEYTGMADERRIGLGPRSIVRRYWRDEHGRECYLEVSAPPEDRGALDIRSSGTGHADSIATQPRSGNVVRAYGTGWR